MAETALSSSPVPVTHPLRLPVFKPLDSRIKELTSSRGELLGRIQKLKLEVQNWRSNLETQVKTCHNELVKAKQGLSSQVQHLKLSNDKTEHA